MGIPQKEVYAEAATILDEMAHNLSVGAVRGVAFLLIKVFKTLFNRIYVNDEGVKNVSGCIQHGYFKQNKLIFYAMIISCFQF